MRGLGFMLLLLLTVTWLSHPDPMLLVMGSTTVSRMADILTNTHSIATTVFPVASTGCTEKNAMCKSSVASAASVIFNPRSFGLRDKVQTVKSPVSLYTASLNREMCALQDGMHSPWQSASGLSAAAEGLRWQYYSHLESRQSGIYPSPKVTTTDCTGNQEQKYYEHPYYAALGDAKDVIILFDTSARDSGYVARFAHQRALAKKIVSTFSIRDSVALVPFNNTADTTTYSGKILQRATDAKLAELRRQIDSIVAPPATVAAELSANIGSAMAEVESMLAVGKSCAKVVVLLTQGVEHHLTRQDVNWFSELKPSISFSAFVSSSSGDDGEWLRSVACDEHGIFVRGTTAADSDTFLRNWVHYLGQLNPSPNVRWVGPYADRHGSGDRIATAVKPMQHTLDTPFRTYAALAQDVATANLVAGHNLAPNSTQMDYGLIPFLLNGDVCTGFGLSSQKGVLDEMSDHVNFCTNPVPSEEDEAEKARIPLIIFFVLFALFLSCLTITFVAADNDGRRTRCVACFVILGLLFWILWMVFLWLWVYPDLVKLHNWDPISMRVLSHRENAYRCCDISCPSSCATASASAPTCAGILALEREGECDNGYYCCETRCRDCNCRDDDNDRRQSKGRRAQSCDCCEECVQSTNSHKCTSRCGTCYIPALATQFTYKGEVMYDRVARHCGRGDVACRDAFFAAHPINASGIQGYINPSNPKQIQFNVTPRNDYLVPWILMSIVLGLVTIAEFGVCCLGLFKVCFKGRSSGGGKYRGGAPKFSDV